MITADVLQRVWLNFAAVPAETRYQAVADALNEIEALRRERSAIDKEEVVMTARHRAEKESHTLRQRDLIQRCKHYLTVRQADHSGNSGGYMRCLICGGRSLTPRSGPGGGERREGKEWNSHP